MTDVVYFDTSALAKWYLNEAGSEDVERYLHRHGPAEICTLTLVEMRALLARRRRAGHIHAALEARVFGTLRDDVRRGFLRCHPLDGGAATGALNLLAQLSEQSLRTLDALHLGVASGIGATHLPTGDELMAGAAEELGLAVVRFG